jgi:sugar transferase (PEP-CTERM/EpsH1 system associated)
MTEQRRVAGESAGGTLRILFISPYLPSPIRTRSYNLIKALAHRGHQITLLALEPPGEDDSGLEALRGWCESVKTVPLPRWRTLYNGLRALPGQTPLQAAYSCSPEMASLIQRTAAGAGLDVAHVEHLRGLQLSRAVDGLPIVFDSVDSITLLFERAARLGPTRRSRLMASLDLKRTRRCESRLLERFPRVLVTSEQDREALVRLSTSEYADRRLVVLANGVDFAYFAPWDRPRDAATLIFTGKMSYHANVAAALDLASQIMPHVWARRPDARLIIAGKDPGAELLALAADPRVTVTGTVPDLRPYLARATVAVVPIRYGVGIQNKLLEAMAMATPVVATPQAIAALQVQPGQDLLIADTAPAVAGALVALLDDEAMRQRIGQSGRLYVEAHHNWDTAASKLESVYREAMGEQKGE